MREDILRELELMPLWRLRKPLPQAIVANDEAAPAAVKVLAPTSAPATTQAEHVDNAASLTVEPAANAEALVTGYQNESGTLCLLHGAGDLNEERKQLLHNIAIAMRLNRYTIAAEQTLSAFCQQQTPAVVLIMGQAVASTILPEVADAAHLSGQAHAYEGVQVVVTADTEAVLSKQVTKAEVWQACRLAMSLVTEA